MLDLDSTGKESATRELYALSTTHRICIFLLLSCSLCMYSASASASVSFSSDHGSVVAVGRLGPTPAARLHDVCKTRNEWGRSLGMNGGRGGWMDG